MERMRGLDRFTESMFTVLKLDDFVPNDHPLRPIRAWLNDARKRMDDVFTRMYEADARGGRPSIAPEKLWRAQLLRVLYSIRSERMLGGTGFVQHAVLLVRRSADEWHRAEPLDVQQDPRAIA
jgi:hypothetical protein